MKKVEVINMKNQPLSDDEIIALKKIGENLKKIRRRLLDVTLIEPKIEIKVSNDLTRSMGETILGLQKI